LSNARNEGAQIAKNDVIVFIDDDILVHKDYLKNINKYLEKKIDDLVVKGVLTRDGADTLHSTRILGNRSAHETISATDGELDIAMDIVENLIKSVYVIPQKAQKLNKKK